jgi:hypothetical protein
MKNQAAVVVLVVLASLSHGEPTGAQEGRVIGVYFGPRQWCRFVSTKGHSSAGWRVPRARRRPSRRSREERNRCGRLWNRSVVCNLRWTASPVHVCGNVHALLELGEDVREFTPVDGTLPLQTLRSSDLGTQCRCEYGMSRIHTSTQKGRDHVAPSHSRSFLYRLRLSPRLGRSCGFYANKNPPQPISSPRGQLTMPRTQLASAQICGRKRGPSRLCAIHRAPSGPSVTPDAQLVSDRVPITLAEALRHS